MKKFFVIGDPHFREGCVREMELFIEETLRIISENVNEVDFIVVLGDVMDRHGILHQKPFHQSCRFLIELSKLRPTYCLIGNHDFDIPSKYLPENHPYKVMTWTEIPNLVIIDKPRVVDDVFLTPYVPPGMFARAVNETFGREITEDPWETLSLNNIRLVFAHQEFLGCQMGRLKSETGDPWPQTPSFDRTPFVVSGHIHDYQRLGENVLYVGTPVQVNYGEGVKKGICLINYDHEEKIKELKWFPIRVPRKLVKTLPLESLDDWVSRRFQELCERYEITIDNSVTSTETKKKPKKATLESKEFGTNSAGGGGGGGFETINNLYSIAPKLEVLRSRIVEDRYLDHLRLQVVISGKISGTVIKNLVIRIKELPIGVQQVFLVDSQTKEKETPRDENGEDQETKTSWMDVLTERVKDNDKKRELLNSLLNDLTNKV